MDLYCACGGGGRERRRGSKNFISVEYPAHAHAPRVYGDVIFVTE